MQSVGRTSPSWVLLAFAPVGAAAAWLAPLSLTSCTGGSAQTAQTTEPVAQAQVPALRLYVTSNVAGAIEPCGCSKDQLGGATHLGSLIAKERSNAPNAMLLGSGPLFFQEPTTTGEKAAQAEDKAHALAKTWAHLGAAAWAPAENDFGAGLGTFEKLAEETGATFVSANLSGSASLKPWKVIEQQGVKVGVIGLSDPATRWPSGLTIAADPALKSHVDAVLAEGAQVVVVLSSMGRAETLRRTEPIAAIDVIVIGKPQEKGDLNDSAKAPTLAGSALVIETSNHLQTVASVDLYFDPKSPSDLTFQDGGGLGRSEEILAVATQIRALEVRINGWEKNPTINAADVAARKRDLTNLRGEKLRLESEPITAPAGPYFKVALREVRENLGQDDVVGDLVLDYYKGVNEHNRVAFSGRLPPPAPPGTAHYVGIEACSTCHAEERAVWDKTAHAKAYATLEKKFVEFNLDCVGCHVTGYEAPGGSTVTSVAELKNVQCETCHGPGSLHTADPGKKGSIVTRPDPQSCVSGCHHPPHVEGFDPTAKTLLILGPGHGQ